MADPEAPVANPLRAELAELARAARLAVGGVPGMTGPVHAIGDGQAWKGPAARRFRDAHLGPAKGSIYPALAGLVDDVEAARDGQPSQVSPEQAKALRQKWGL